MNTFSKKFSLVAIGMTVCLSMMAVPFTHAHPLFGRDVLKFSQKPMDGTQFVSPDGETHTFWGHDELSTAYSQWDATGPTPYRGTFMADDFADRFSSPVVHVKWWGSYLDNFQSPDMPVNKFLISFESDVPQGPNNPFSHPGQPLLNQIVHRGPLAPGSGTFTEKQISAGGPPLGEELYEYNAELHLGSEFFQKPDTVYWLKIVALVDLPPGVQIDPFQPTGAVPRWGWHNRDYTIHNPLASVAPAVAPGEDIVGLVGPAPGGTPIWHFQDDAVSGRVRIDMQPSSTGILVPVVEQFGFRPEKYRSGIDGPGLIGEYSKDLAFELYTVVPEPTSVILLLAGCAGLAATQRRGRPALWMHQKHTASDNEPNRGYVASTTKHIPQ